MNKIEVVGKFLQDVSKKAVNQEKVDVDGGYTVGADLVAQILSPDFAEGSLYARCNIFNVAGNRGLIPTVSQSTRGLGGINGGVQSYWVGEDIAPTQSKSQFNQLDLPLNKLVVMIPVTDELIEDAQNLAKYISETASKAILRNIDKAIVYGASHQLNGLNTSTASITVTAATPISIPNIKSMIDSYYGGINGAFVMSKPAWNQVKDLYENTLALEFDAEEGAILFGYPVIVSEIMNNFDIVLGDFSQYAIAQKELRNAVNMSVRFLEGEQLFKFMIRINGANTWTAGITLQTSTLSSVEVIDRVQGYSSALIDATHAAGTFDMPMATNGYSPVLSGLGTFSVDVSASEWTFADTLTAGILSPIGASISAGNMAGTVNYTTGAWTLTLSAISPYITTTTVLDEVEEGATIVNGGYIDGIVTYPSKSATGYTPVISAKSFNVDVSASAYTFTDNGQGTLVGNSGASALSGAVNYTTGEFSVNFANIVLPSSVGNTVSATYDYTYSTVTTIGNQISATADYTYTLDVHDATNDVTVYPFVIARV